MTRQNGFHGPALPTAWGTTQVNLVSTTIFNVIVENVIWTWLVMTVEDHRVAHNSMGESVGRWLGVFYDNDGMVGSRDAEWLQQSMNVLVSIFLRYGLTANFTKSFKMACQPGALRSAMSVKANALKYTGLGDSYRLRLWRWIPCPERWVELTTGSMTAQRWHMHRTEPAIEWIWLTVSQTDHHLKVYDMNFLSTTKRCP